MITPLGRAFPPPAPHSDGRSISGSGGGRRGILQKDSTISLKVLLGVAPCRDSLGQVGLSNASVQRAFCGISQYQPVSLSQFYPWEPVGANFFQYHLPSDSL